MEKAELFEHNEIAYKKLCESLKSSKVSTINHATGTGKSFIALKYLYENNDKKFLYIAPTYPIIDQLIKSCYKIGLTPEDINIDTMIYHTLLGQNMDELYEKYDGFIFDEYHRTGAPETYKKIKQIKLNLMNHDDDKKIIGLTATPIRYLDRERNMTQEVFDDVVASNLSLSKAMLEEILPVPIYINSKISCRPEYEKILKKVNKFAPSEEKDELMKQVDEIAKEMNNGDQDINSMLKQYANNPNGKYIVFCPNIVKLEEYYRNSDIWFKDIGKINKYQVHSDKKKSFNQSEIDKFNEQQECISLLFCVDILNEGLHVDDIDGVILLRRTQSPIIYFQQIGRALSFSGRNKQIKIFDLVNNFGNHSAIDAIYLEVKEEMKKRIMLHPENKEKYEQVLSRFKIMDDTREIIQKMKNLKKKISPEGIIISKLKYEISNLEKAVEGGKIDIFNNGEIKKAFFTVSRYYKYVDNDMFQRLSNLGIILPANLSMSYEERLKMLDGFSSIREKEKNLTDLYIQKIFEFMENEHRRPDMQAVDSNERKIANRYLQSLMFFDEKQKQKFIEIMDKNKIKYKSYEKALVDKKLDVADMDDLINLGNEFVKNNRTLPEFLKQAIEVTTLQYTTKKNEDLYDILDNNEKILQEEKARREQERYEQMNLIMNFLDENENVSEQQLKDKIQEVKVGILTGGDIGIIRKKFIDCKKKYYGSLISSEETSDMGIFCKSAKIIQREQLNLKLKAIKNDKELYEVMKKYAKFVLDNNGNKPLIDSEDENQKELAEKVKKYIDDGKISEIICNNNEDGLYNPAQILYQIAVHKEKELNIKMTILECVDFYRRKGYRPLNNSSDESERVLALKYEHYCVKNLSQDNLTELNKIFLSKKNLGILCSQYLKNKRGER